MRAAVIGCGPVGALHAAGLASCSDATLVAVCDPSAERRDQLAARFGATPYEDLPSLLKAERPELVTVATPDDRHLEPVLISLAAGCHVFCEKPLATRLGDAEAMVAAARKTGRFLGVDFNRRFGFAYRRARELIDARKVGTVQQVAVQVADGFPPLSVRRAPGAIFTTLLTHHFDLVRWLIDEPQCVCVAGSIDPATNLLANVAITLRFRRGAVGTICAAYRVDQRRTHEMMTIVGDRGSLVIEDVTRSVTLFGTGPEHCESWRAGSGDSHDPFWQTIEMHVQHFVAAVRRGDSPAVTGADGVASLRIAAAAEKSWSCGAPVEMVEKGDGR